MTKNGSQQTTKAPVMMASVLAAFRSRRDSMLRRLLVLDAAATAAAATDVMRLVIGLVFGFGVAVGCCCSDPSTHSSSETDGGGRPRLSTPTAAAMMVQVVSVETLETPVLVELVGAAEETAPRILRRMPSDADAMPLLGCCCCFRLLMRFLAVRKILQYKKRMMANGR